MSVENDEKLLEKERRMMVEDQIESRGVKGKALLTALKKIPRHLFVPADFREYAYSDQALPSYCGQTISQPYIVAIMTEMLSLDKSSKVLEIGTGTGYQTTILAELANEVYTMEIIPELHDIAKNNPVVQNYNNIKFILGDGYKGYEAAAPYDAIIVTAAPPYVPEALTNQLAPGGRMVIPVGAYEQTLYLVTKDLDDKISMKPLLWVQFVPMIKKKDL
ncbi:protein-L-isoaspartate(D-aspartate) O-methyltransferase [Bacteroides luti]|uniref:Protein-L-isoaspartate O-methyltransferase n=1 Tax=Bacteroides luti TaxID=1297750 RepID=A0A1M5BCD1_9BACE|nr:protein-L-isoaspartate(D-aspartate) O-methyltransferase [Bacteroides luti]SHF40174.1 protein-L-isoaspartate(D-aspartate) O-methyltransferase [Bacteroides luti]